MTEIAALRIVTQVYSFLIALFRLIWHSKWNSVWRQISRKSAITQSKLCLIQKDSEYISLVRLLVVEILILVILLVSPGSPITNAFPVSVFPVSVFPVYLFLFPFPAPV